MEKLGNSFLIFYPLPQPPTNFYFPPLNYNSMPPCSYHLKITLHFHTFFPFFSPFFLSCYTPRIELLTFRSVWIYRPTSSPLDKVNNVFCLFLTAFFNGVVSAVSRVCQQQYVPQRLDGDDNASEQVTVI